MNLKMKTLAAAMIAVGSVSITQASELTFPYVVNGSTVTTVLSVLNTAEADNTVHHLNMALNYKNVDANGKIDPLQFCSHTDGQIVSSTNDLTTFALGTKFGVGAMFGDTMGGAKGGTLTDFGFLTNISSIPATRGYVQIWNEAPGVDGTITTLDGEALIIDYASGAAWGYRALKASADGTSVPYADAGGNVLWENDGIPSNVPFLPLNEVQTRFFVTPISSGDTNNNPMRAGLNGAVAVTYGGGINPTLFDRLEVGTSLNTVNVMNCLGVVDIQDLIGAAANYPQYQKGGFAPLALNGIGSNYSSVIKLEFSKSNTLNGVAIGGTYNNAYQITNN